MKRGREESSNDPFVAHHLACLTWLWVVKMDPHIRRCVNKDIVKKIVGYLKVNLRDGFGEFYLLKSVSDTFWFSDTIWFWRNTATSMYDARPCVGCLRPIPRYGNDDCKISCDKCKPPLNDHASCCKIWGNSLESQCFEQFRRFYDLPDSDHS